MTEQITPPRVHRGYSAPTVQELLDTETRPVPDFLRDDSDVDLGTDGVDVQRYLSQEFHDLEMEHVWRKVWQMACREEEIPEVGDHILYEIGDDSIIVVRCAPDEIRGFYNVCLHRGRRLRVQDGYVPEFRCPFHAFTWNLDGTLKDVPARWDFPQIEDDKFSLPHVKVDTWGGFVFINMDLDAAPLATQLDGIQDHFDGRPLEERYKVAHVAKLIRANWKVLQEAFIESFHVIGTHPQLLQSNGDENTQYDVWPDKPHVSRSISPAGVPSPHLGDIADQDVLDNYLVNRRYYAAKAANRDLAVQEDIEAEDGRSARQTIANLLRQQLAPVVGDAAAEASTDSELLDAIQYFVFPNFFPWLQTGSSLVYRFRPYKNDPDMSIAEIIFLSPFPPGTERPAPAPVHWLDIDDDWTKATELGRLAGVLNQDSGNVPIVQQGLKTLARQRSQTTLARYQEVRIRHFHETIDAYIAKGQA